MKFVLTHKRKEDGKIDVVRRECTRKLEYKGLYFAACPNRIDGARPYNYDILEVSTGLKVTQVPRLKDGYPYIRDKFYPITKQLKTPYAIAMMKNISNYVAKNGEVDLIIDMDTVFNSLREIGILDNILI